MMGRGLTHAAVATALALAMQGCTPGGSGDDGIIKAGEAEVFDAIAADETVQFSGTEPFWGGEVTGSELRYSTPDNIDGVRIIVERFAGNNGLSFSGELNGQPFDLAVTPGECSDGMSDRSYPFVATLQIGEETRSGCAWTDDMPFTGPENP